MNMMAVPFQSDVTFSRVNAFPQINQHYFVIYTLVSLVFAFGIAWRAKLYHPTDAQQPLSAGDLQVFQP